MNYILKIYPHYVSTSPHHSQGNMNIKHISFWKISIHQIVEKLEREQSELATANARINIWHNSKSKEFIFENEY